MYSAEPVNKKRFTQEFDQAYSRFARPYDLVVRWLPIWRRWISEVIPEISGSAILEVSFGTGYLMTRYADRYYTCGIDYNWAMVYTAKRNLLRSGVRANIQQADVQQLPYRADTFDTVVNTMSFTGYPDGKKALAEMRRVLKPGGRLVLMDVNYPKDRNRIGMKLVRGAVRIGDIIRDMDFLFDQLGFRYTEKEVGGFGSVHLYVATKM